MTDDDVIKVLRNHRKDSFGANDKQLTRDRAEAMDRYHGRPYGDEEEGFSQFVTKDLAENVDWAMPTIMRPFIQSGTLAEFKPDSEDDEEQVQVESDYTNYVIMEDNDGFISLHDVVKDALILRNGYFNHEFEELDEVYIREWSNLSDMELSLIKDKFENDSTTFEIIETEEESEDSGQYKKVAAKITTKVRRINVEAVPPEELKISNNCRGSLQKSDYVGHEPRKTRSDLIEMGIDKEWLDKISGTNNDSQSQYNDNTESDARDKATDETDETTIDIDKSMQYMSYSVEYVRMDFDDDGIAELRRIVTVSDQIPTGKEWNRIVDSIPFTGVSPKRMPHRHIGESFQDDLSDLAEQHTTLVRQLFDNTYKTTNNQWAFNDRVDEAEFLDQGPSAAFRVEGKEPVNGSIEAIRHDSIAQHLLPVISYVEEKKKKRTGVNEGDLDPNVLMQATKGAFMEDLSRKSQKMEMTTRMIAESVKELVINVHALIVKHQLKADSVKLGGNFTSIDPSEWSPRKKVVVKVGLGTGNSEERIRNLTLLKGLQEELKERGLVTDEEAYKLYVDIAKELGETNPEKYAVTPDPQNPKYAQIKQQQKAAQAQGQQNPLAEAEAIKGKFSIQKEQMSNQYKGQIEQLRESNKNTIEQLREANKANASQNRLQFEMMLQNQKAEFNRELLFIKEQFKLAQNHDQIMSDETKKAAELEKDYAVEGMKVDLGQPGIGAGLQDER